MPPRRRKKRRIKRRIWWSRLSDEKLLQVRLKDLHVKVEGTWLERWVRQLHQELEERGIRFMPHVWISDEWFSPSNTPGIAIPFYLAHPRLMRLERSKMIHVEGDTEKECMRILRHEAVPRGPACLSAATAADAGRNCWPRSKRYPSDYWPDPASKTTSNTCGRW